jgi:hypothetical protein
MSTPLDLSTYQRPDGTWVMTGAGEVDMSNAGAFQQGLADLVTVRGVMGEPGSR